MINKLSQLICGIIIILELAACSPTPASSPTGSPDEGQTRIARSVAETITAYAKTVQPTPRDTPTASLVPTDTLIATPTKIAAALSEDSNCRSGPGLEYDITSYLTHGLPFELIATNDGGTWFLVQDTPTSTYWIESKYFNGSLPVSDLKVLTPPPTPTSIPPDFSVSYVRLQQCYEGHEFVFLIKNTGNTTWESAIVLTDDAYNAKKTRYESNHFAYQTYVVAEYEHTLSLSAVENLPPRQSLFIPSALFNPYNPGNIVATITLCSEDNGGGYCLTKTLNFKP